jgi:pyridoxamine 5'-phosphate oxidase
MPRQRMLSSEWPPYNLLRPNKKAQSRPMKKSIEELNAQAGVQTQIADLREDYKLAALEENGVRGNPIEQFSLWFSEAQHANLREPNAMTLATADAYGRPSARIVLLKGVSPEGFTWFTNYQSRKGDDLGVNAHAALVFFWNELERQVRIEGIVTKIASDESDAYFNSRPEGSRLGAWASPQSQVIESRASLEAREKLFKQQFNIESGTSKSGLIPRPAHWGGYQLNPTMIEFWQGRSSRLHDRLRFSRSLQTEAWRLDRLAP